MTILSKFAVVSTIRRASANWIRLIFLLNFNMHIEKIKFRDGQVIHHSDLRDLDEHGVIFALCKMKIDAWEIQPRVDSLYVTKNFLGFPFEKISLIIRATEILSTMEVVVDQVYRTDNLKGKTVVDIGMNVGDSSIYFALMGARKVIGIEPIYDTFGRALDNIRRNRMEKIILPILGAVSEQQHNVEMVFSEKNSGITSVIEYLDTKPEVIARQLTNKIVANGYTFESILSATFIEKVDLLKIDCEGCEYGLISDGSFRIDLISELIVEYHDRGPNDLVSRLENRGFICKVTEVFGKKTGFIYAKRN